MWLLSMCSYPFTVEVQESTGLQCSEVEPSFKVVEGRDLCSRSQVPLSIEKSFTGHLLQQKHSSLSSLITFCSQPMDLSSDSCVSNKAVEAALTKDSSGQPLLIPMVPGSSSRLKSFFWNWKPFTQPFRPTGADSSGLWWHTYCCSKLL